MNASDTLIAFVPYIIAASIDSLIFEIFARLFPRLRQRGPGTFYGRTAPLDRFLLPLARVLSILCVVLGVPWLIISRQIQALWIPLIIISIIFVVLQIISFFGKNITTR